MTDQLLSHSRSDSFKRCRKRHWFEYEIGLRPTTDSRALRMGSAYHDGLDRLKTGGGMEAAATAARSHYEAMPPEYDAYDWEIERETVAAMLSGYQWRWNGVGLQVQATEQSFRLPLVNPATGASSKLWELAGKIDGIVTMDDGRLAVLEHKLISDDLAQDSDWWRRLQMDPQVSIYVYAARQLGYDVATVLYDVARKPTIKPSPVPLLDNLGAKIVLDSRGERVKTAKGDWRQTGSEKDGYVLQTRPCTPEEWSQKLVDDIGRRPEFYYARVEVPRLDQEIEECQAELWDIQLTIRQAQLKKRWFRTVSKDTCSWCAWFGPCSTKWRPETGLIPGGFEYVTDKHPKLQEETQS